ncbi:MAG: peptide chain release factor N(5)-glutamine methyltransferase [Chloroflexi bacterium]|nr:peptide chain release factor N(5)-glutamine methyltransferase [Chloroflexota bacterium]
MSVSAALERMAARPPRAGIARPRQEASLLRRHATGLSESSLLAHPEQSVPPSAAARLETWTERRTRHEPMAYILARREFYGREFAVNPRVLIPRPETELLVELALRSTRHTPPALVADVGTGSGCLAVTLAIELPRATVVASDTSEAALAVAASNAARHGVGGRVRFVQGDLLSWLVRRPDLVVANLPYVPSARIARLEPDVRDFEPRSALDGGPDGTDLIQRLLHQLMDPGFGAALLEVDDSHARAVAGTARALWPERTVRVHEDLAGQARILEICQ